MKSAVIAITPTLNDQPAKLERVGRQLAELQGRGLFSTSAVASVMHPSLYPFPAEYYQRVKLGLSRRNKARLERELRKWFRFSQVHMLSAPSSENLLLAEKLSSFAQRHRAEILVVNQPEEGWLKRLFGRVAEVTAFAAELPVLVLKSDQLAELAQAKAKIVLAVDPRSPPSAGELQMVADAAKRMQAEVHLLHVHPAERALHTAFRMRTPSGQVMRKLWGLEAELELQGVVARSVLIEEQGSLAAAIENYADVYQACLVAVTTPERPLLRKFLLGSTARKLVQLSRRPVLLLRPPPAAGQAA